ncbi:MAG: TetR/AcrR family transcriptional regulator [Alphaproteobacteria bacterium]|nr:TetR/AcrR family transcriptional regulator [Alphaproteobacteria bacterium]
MSPKLVDKDLRRQELALAALAVFAERGFARTSMSQVAEAAGVAKGTLYLYFSSKEELVVAAASAWVAQVEAAAPPPIDPASAPLPRLRALLQASTRAFLEDPSVVKLFLAVLRGAIEPGDPLARLDVVQRVSAPIRSAIVGILRDGAARGLLRPEVAQDAERLAVNVVAFVDGLGLHHLASPGRVDLDAQLDLYLEALFGSLQAPDDPLRQSPP